MLAKASQCFLTNIKDYGSDGPRRWRHQEELQPTDAVALQTAPAQRKYFIWRVEAQSMTQQVPLKERLEAGEPIIRREAVRFWQTKRAVTVSKSSYVGTEF
jgi:hypothetical protein